MLSQPTNPPKKKIHSRFFIYLFHFLFSPQTLSNLSVVHTHYVAGHVQGYVPYISCRKTYHVMNHSPIHPSVRHVSD